MKAAHRIQRIGKRQTFWRLGGAVFWLTFGFLPAAFCQNVVSSPPDIKDIVPPQNYHLGGGWMWLAVAGACLVLAALILWQLLRPRRRAPAPLPSPREVAARRLRELEERMASLDARTFGGAVCDVLRAYIGGEFGLAAERQTSPEFLASITGSRAFSVREHHLLAEFLDACDLLKFARADATLDGKRHLLTQATEFLENSSRAPAVEESEVGSRNAAVKTW